MVCCVRRHGRTRTFTPMSFAGIVRRRSSGCAAASAESSGSRGAGSRGAPMSDRGGGFGRDMSGGRSSAGSSRHASGSAGTSGAPHSGRRRQQEVVQVAPEVQSAPVVLPFVDDVASLPAALGLRDYSGAAARCRAALPVALQTAGASITGFSLCCIRLWCGVVAPDSELPLAASQPRPQPAAAARSHGTNSDPRRCSSCMRPCLGG